MKKISLGLLIFTFAAAVVRGQDAATQQQIDKLTGALQDAQAALDTQRQQMDALRQQLAELRDKVNTPAANDYASRDDLKALAEKVQEVDRKRQEDRDLILKEIEKLGKVAGAAPTRSKPSVPKMSEETPAPTGPENGHYYTVQAGDSLGAIAKAYRDQGVKVTTPQILKANPGLDANKLYVGKKIFIPDPTAK